jgi:hypothetical protein
MSHLPHPWFNHPKNIQWKIQVMKFIIMHFFHDLSFSLAQQIAMV